MFAKGRPRPATHGKQSVRLRSTVCIASKIIGFRAKVTRVRIMITSIVAAVIVFLEVVAAIMVITATIAVRITIEIVRNTNNTVIVVLHNSINNCRNILTILPLLVLTNDNNSICNKARQ